ncbi:hypothetical protein E8E11_009298 [Didymella keratinophila]|nr:hypothetical protein E8E11_009298 [Didymella keratinophila]
MNKTRMVLELATKHNTFLVTTQANGGASFPSVLETQFLLNHSFPLIFAHASFLSVQDAQLLRQYNHYTSTMPESEMHYCHLHPYSHLILDQASLGNVRKTFYGEVVERRRAPANNPMSVNQAFLLATRNGGVAMRRLDFGVLAPGAKADLVIWNGRSPSMLGWRDPVAAFMLHASVGDVKHVMVDGQFVKRDGQLRAQNHTELQERFLQSAERIQDIWTAMDMPILEGETQSSVAYERTS